MSRSVTVREIDGRSEQQSYDPRFIRRARLLWCLLGSQAEVERRMGITDKMLSNWKERRQPDGQDWDVFREELAIADQDKMFGMVGPAEVAEIHERLVRDSLRVLSVAMAGLEQEDLYDEAGNKVEMLYTRTGRKVPMRIRPTSLTQVSGALEASYKVISKELAALEQLEEGQQQRRLQHGALFRQWMEQLGGAAVEVLGEKGWRKLRDKMLSGELVLDEDGEVEQVTEVVGEVEDDGG